MSPPPCITPFLSVLHQNKALHDFGKREQHSIVERNIGLEYALETESVTYLQSVHSNIGDT